MKSLKRGGTCAKPSSRDPHGASAVEVLRATGASAWIERPEQPVNAIHCEKQTRKPRTIMARMPLLRRGLAYLMRRLSNRFPPLYCFPAPEELLRIPQQVIPHDRGPNSRYRVLGAHQAVGTYHTDHK